MDLGKRMKEYEIQSRTRLLKRTPVIVRIDGKSFHTFTRGFDKPFDKDLMYAMQYTMLELCKNVQNCVLGYTQSDEITLVLIDYKDIKTSTMFDNQVQKLVSVTSSMATLYFNQALNELINRNMFSNNTVIDDNTVVIDDITELFGTLNKKLLLEDKLFKALFDSRVFNIPKEEVVNNLIWRQQDAIRNSLNSLARSLFPHKELQGIKRDKLYSKMFIEKNVNWNNLDTYFKRGACAIKNSNGEWIIDKEIPIFTDNREYIAERLV